MQNFIKLMVEKIILSLISIILMANFAYSANSAVKIGVLAKRGHELCLEKWSPTAEYLTENIPGKTFVIVPLDYDQIYTVVENGEVDFILANPSFYVELESWFRVSRIATLKNKMLNGVWTKFGGVIICKKNRKDICRLADLSGKTFMAVEERSFGGWRMAWREFKEAGIDPFKSLASISFGGTHDAVVYAVRDGKVDAGTVRADTFERMQTEGKISADDFNVIHEHGGGDVHLPFIHSTREYPEWPVAKLKHISNEVAEKVAIALINMPADSAAANAASSGGWTIPLNYQPVHECLKELKLGPYKDLGKITVSAVVKKYWIFILAIAILFAVVSGSAIFILYLNRNIKKIQIELLAEVEERKQAEVALRKSEGDMRGILDAITETIVLIDRQGMVITVDQIACERLGTKKEDLIGRCLYDFFPPEVAEKRKRKYEEVFNTGKSVCFEDSRESMTFEQNVYPILSDRNRVERVAIFAREITDRKLTEETLRESEEKYRSMMESMKDAVYICSTDYRVEYMNSALIKRTGRDATGENCFKALHDLNEKCSWCVHDKVKQGEHIESDIVSPRDNRSYHVSQSPVVHEDGSISKMTVYIDTTDFKKMETQLQQAQKMEAIGTLAGGIAHDFNNILFPISGYAEMLLQDIPDDSPLRHGLSKILAGSKRAGDLVTQILTFSRQRERKLKPLKIELLVKEALKLIRSSLPTTINIRQNINKDCGLVMADPTQIHQIVMNLCTNAFHAMEEAGGKLTITLEKVELAAKDLKNPAMIPGQHICLMVADTGPGMEQSIIDRIFDPYFTTKVEGKGTGLGLAVVHGIIESHGGQVSVYSESGNGAKFKVYLPVIKEQKETAEIEAHAPIQKGDERILLIDDEDIIAQMEKEMLERLGYHVTARTSSTDALEAFRTQPDKFDLVITDLTMPNMTGDKLAQKLMVIRPDMPVILCTGFSEKMSKEKAEALGIKGFLMKPVVISDLAKTIREVLEKNQKGDKNGKHPDNR